jgi:hypothetical protein
VNRGTAVSPLDRQADQANALLGRLGVVERAGHVHGDGALSGHRNRLLNGCFRVWQRGAGAFTGNGAYSADRWQLGSSGSSQSVTLQVFTPGASSSLAPRPMDEPVAYLRSVVTNVAGANSYVILTQRVAGVRALAGQTATLSFWAKASAVRRIGVELQQEFGAGGSATVLGIGSRSVEVGTTWARYAITVDVPALTGKVLGSSGDALAVTLWLNAGSTYAARSGTVGAQAGTFDVWGVQLEQGPSASAFEYRPAADELRYCQEHFYRMASRVSGIWIAADGLRAIVPFPVRMRVAPSAVMFLTTPYAEFWNQAVHTGSASAVSAVAGVMSADCTVGGFTGAGRSYGQAAILDPCIDFSAEL